MAAREERRGALRGGGQDARWANSARCPAGTGAAVARAATHASARQERSMIVGGEVGGACWGVLRLCLRLVCSSFEQMPFMFCSLANPLEESHLQSRGAARPRGALFLCGWERRRAEVCSRDQSDPALGCWHLLQRFSLWLLAPARRSKSCVSSSTSTRGKLELSDSHPSLQSRHVGRLDKPRHRRQLSLPVTPVRSSGPCGVRLDTPHGHAQAACTVTGSRHGLPSRADTVKDSVTCQVHSELSRRALLQLQPLLQLRRVDEGLLSIKFARC